MCTSFFLVSQYLGKNVTCIVVDVLYILSVIYFFIWGNFKVIIRNIISPIPNFIIF